MSYIGNLWNRLSNIGVDEEMDFQLQHRVILSNRLGAIISLLIIVFMIIFSFRENTNFLLMAVILISTLGILILNFFKLHSVSRLFVSIIPALAVLWINLTTKIDQPENVGIVHYISPRMLITSSLVLPFTLFSTKERSMLGVGLVVIIVVSVLYDSIHEMFGVAYEQLNITADQYGVVYEDMFLAIVMLLSSSVFLFNLNNMYEKKNISLLEEANVKNEEALKSEEELKKTLKEVEIARAEDEKRNWATKGLADLASLLQSKMDQEELYDRLISYIVNYLDINQGGLYVINDEDADAVTIDLVSSYAYSRKKYVSNSYEVGQGLIGQTFLEGETLYLKDVPQGYISITSGLGEATPSCIIIVPLKVNERTEGVLELASFKPFESHYIEFLEKAGESIAASVSTNKVTARTETLLNSSQQMTEEMRAQEEEMRQNMEELSATQEEMARKEKEYIARIQELEAQLEQEEQ
ncbi:GAF domain-containing protein [Fulvivirga sp. 29W222]|uniref:GAF domain-containing protein n=1 Tax=Fulvivirga marina TaxID=2494733 RepID=A0A937FTK0_9BACT|nr:GAF domain-containing protein [Fulvivirga marina]MBL6445645.1 GAF domain-containing protein [Fulvivirga marina]